jgi:hypothetical protein
VVAEGRAAVPGVEDPGAAAQQLCLQGHLQEPS